MNEYFVLDIGTHIQGSSLNLQGLTDAVHSDPQQLSQNT
jgi:hypothetical protein